mgnify:CR=1 FL=1
MLTQASRHGTSDYVRRLWLGHRVAVAGMTRAARRPPSPNAGSGVWRCARTAMLGMRSPILVAPPRRHSANIVAGVYRRVATQHPSGARPTLRTASVLVLVLIVLAGCSNLIPETPVLTTSQVKERCIEAVQRKLQLKSGGSLRFTALTYTDEGNRTYTARGSVSGGPGHFEPRRFECWLINDGSHDDQAVSVSFT